MRCPHCNTRLIRRLDLQCFIVGNLFFVLGLPIVIIPMPLVWQVVLVAGVMAAALYVDAITVRLVEARRWRGILGYDA
jgi:hypothetical protein